MRGNRNLINEISKSDLRNGEEKDLKGRLFEKIELYGLGVLRELPLLMREDYINQGYNFEKSKRSVLKLYGKIKKNYGEGSWLQ